MLCVEAFDVAEQLGVARLLNADDMLLLVVPDKLNVMTFVYQLRAQLTGASVPPHHSHSPLPISSPSAISSPPPRTQTSPTSGDWLSNLCPLTATEQQAVDARYAASLRTSSEVQSVVQTGKQLLACVGQSSEVVDHVQTASQSPPLNDSVDSAVLMTRQQLLNPFDSDSDSESKSAATLLSSDTGKHQLSLLAQDASLSRVQQPQTAESHARTTFDQTSSSPSWKHCEQLAGRAGGSSSKGESSVDTHSTGAATHSSGGEGSPTALSVDKSGVDTVPGAHRQCSRREQLRERARLLLQQARHDAVTSPMSPVVDSEDERHRRLRERARKLIAESRAGAAAGSSITQVITVHSRKAIGQSVSVPTGEMYGCEHILQQRHDVNKLTSAEQHAGSPSSPAPPTSYAEVEIEFLERSLARLDERAAGVEWSLRRIMDSQRTADDDSQQRLMYEWFALVDERGELVRRIEQLNAVAQEQDLERRFELLSVELRRLMAEGDANEDEDCADRERLLLAELMTIVNQRDALVQQLDQQEQETTVKSTPVVEARKNSRQDAGCSIQ